MKKSRHTRKSNHLFIEHNFLDRLIKNFPRYEKKSQGLTWDLYVLGY